MKTCSDEIGIVKVLIHSEESERILNWGDTKGAKTAFRNFAKEHGLQQKKTIEVGMKILEKRIERKELSSEYTIREKLDEEYLLLKREIIFDTFPWHTRKRKIQLDRYVEKGYTETNGKWGWDCVKWHYVGIKITKEEIEIDIAEDGENFKYKIPEGFFFSFQERGYRKEISENAYWNWNGKFQLVVKFHREKYHFSLRNKMYKDIKKKIREGIKMIKQRRKAQYLRMKTDRLAKRDFLKFAKTIYVTFADSIASGNCRIETKEFLEEMKRKIGLKTITGIRGDFLLSIRDDVYTRRAILFAVAK